MAVLRRIVGWLDSRGAIRLVQFGVLASLLMGVMVTYQQHALVDCLARYNNAFAKVTQDRSRANEDAVNAEDRLWQAVYDAQKLPPAEARKVSQDAFNEYIAERTKARKDRADHPLPPPPKQSC